MTHPLLTTLQPATPDPIFAIAQAAKAAGPDAIDGTVGIFLGEDGKPFVLRSVKKALKDIAEGLTARRYAYPHLLGLPEYRETVQRMIFGEHDHSIASIATTGGTGAVAINLRLLKLLDPAITLIAPVPTWANHRNLWTSAGVRAQEVPYLEDGKPSIDAIADAVGKATSAAAILLHVGCHNPLGLDFSGEQWTQLAALCSEHQTIPLLDFAYQGFKADPDADAAPVRVFAQGGMLALACWSASKNHSLYSERAGLACAVTDDEETRAKIEGHYMILTRGLHSAAPTFGQSVIALVQERYHAEWLKDLLEARSMMEKKRTLLKSILPSHFMIALDGFGMFAVLPLTRDQVLQLRTEHNVYLTDDGRINIAGIPLRRIPELAEKLLRV